MKKLFLILGVLSMLTSGMAIADELPTIEPVTFKWAMSTAIDHPASIITQEMCDEVYQRTNGAVTIELFVANTIGSESEITDMVRSGSILGGAIGIQMFENFVPDMAGWRLPFIASAAYWAGQAWPLERTNLSLSAQRGSAGSTLMNPK